MPSVKFYLKQPRRNGRMRTDEVSIFAVFTIDRKTRFEVVSGEHIQPKNWNPGQQRVRSSYRGSVEINNRLKVLSDGLMDLWFKNKADPTEFACLARKFAKTGSTVLEKKTLQKAFDAFIAQAREEKDKKTWQKYQTLRGRLNEFNPNLEFADLTMTFYDQFKQFLYAIPNPNYKGHSLKNQGDYYDIIEGKKGLPIGLFDESVSKYITPLKVFLQWALERNYEVDTCFKKWKVIKLQHKPISLTIHELEKLESALLTGNLAIARDYLSLECRIGQRISDIRRFSKSQLKGNTWTFFPRKGNRLGKREVTVHFEGYCAKALDILRKYDYKMPELSEQKINKNIKLACKQAGIDSPVEIFRTAQNKRVRFIGPKYEFISTHTGRKTFITIALQFMPHKVVMELAGIESYATLKHYEDKSDHGIVKGYLNEMSLLKKAL